MASSQLIPSKPTTRNKSTNRKYSAIFAKKYYTKSAINFNVKKFFIANQINLSANNRAI
ncbi:MAG: hypothetical protein LBL39_03880 [Planctomycetaceae bacterium]|nr:hypothetical protein [Planctomycetaceae bacterium]